MKYTVTTQSQFKLAGGNPALPESRPIAADTFEADGHLTIFYVGLGANRKPVAAFSDVIAIEPEKVEEAK